MAFVKRIKIELWSLGIAATVTALFWSGSVEHNYANLEQLSATQIRAEAAFILDKDARDLRVGKAGDHWLVTDDVTVARLNERGELLEVEFRPAF